MAEFKPCIVIPCYNHESLIGQMLSSLDTFKIPCYIIEDGSEKEAAEQISQTVEKYPWATLFKRPENGGKGAAVIDGFKLAEQNGFTHVLQIDADCQHNVNDIPDFLKLAENNPEKLVIGQAEYDKSVPKSRLYGRYITHFWVMLETLSFSILDTMCGFRVYSLSSLKKINLNRVGNRMDFDVEIAVKMIWAGIKIIKKNTRVIYPENGISNFHYLKGNIRISLMHTRLFLGMVIRSPMLLIRKVAS